MAAIELEGTYNVADAGILVAAVDEGYLDIPRSCSLAELGTQFDISSNAASERFRRGSKTLIENTLSPDDQPT